MAETLTATPVPVPVVFHRPKAGSMQAEWEDGAGHDAGDLAAGRSPRFVVVDGATEAYDALRWVRQLVTSFLGMEAGPPPALTREGLDAWFGRMQQRWIDESPRTFASVFEECKFHNDGSFATFVGCELTGLGSHRPRWTAAAIGDAVLFHLRDDRVVTMLPRMAPEDFSLNPDGVSTQPTACEGMRAALLVESAPLQVGDVLVFATDAVAHWLTESARASGSALWRMVRAIEHPDDFARLVARERHLGRMKNDDATLMRVQIAPVDADVLVVCR